MTSRTRVIAGTVGLLLTMAVLASCAEPTGTQGAGSPVTMSPDRPSTELPGPINWQEPGLALRPVDVTSVQAVPEQVARASIEAMAGEESLHAYLARQLQTDPLMYAAPPPEGRLVWAFIDVHPFTSADVHDYGPVPPAGATPPPRQDMTGATCTAIWLADATSGAYIEGESGCGEATGAPGEATGSSMYTPAPLTSWPG